MRAALVNLCASRTYQMPPLGLMYLAAVLKRSTDVCISVHDALIDLDDCSSVETVAAEIMGGNPDILCFSIYTEHHQYLRRLIKVCRRNAPGRIGIILGGPHATLATESCVRTLDAAYVIRGPGERLLPVVLNSLFERLGKDDEAVLQCDVCDIPISCNSDLSLPDFLPDRECLNLNKYQHPFTLITSRGCPGKCTFCASPAINKGFSCPRSIESIKIELEYLVRKLGACRIALLDDSFTHEQARLEQLCGCLAGFGLKWFCESRIDCIDENKLRMMADAGCCELQFGIECFDQDLSNRIGKRIDTSRIPGALRAACDSGIKVAVSLILGLPGDTVASIKARIRKAVELADLGVQVIEFSCLRPFPGTVIYERAEEWGYLDVTNWWERDNPLPLCFPSSTITREELVGMLIYAGYKIQMDSKAVCETSVRATGY
jgi:anaerobic magnesium-protoporphyrin IX monomethyl ester cyclase